MGKCDHFHSLLLKLKTQLDQWVKLCLLPMWITCKNILTYPVLWDLGPGKVYWQSIYVVFTWFQLNPSASKALKLMHKLAADPGIVAIMNKVSLARFSYLSLIVYGLLCWCVLSVVLNFVRWTSWSIAGVWVSWQRWHQKVLLVFLLNAFLVSIRCAIPFSPKEVDAEWNHVLNIESMNLCFSS